MKAQSTRHFMPVSKHIPPRFFPFKTGAGDLDAWSFSKEWEYRLYEMPSPGSLGGVISAVKTSLLFRLLVHRLIKSTMIWSAMAQLHAYISLAWFPVWYAPTATTLI